MNQGCIKLIISETSPYPHGARVLKEWSQHREIEVVSSYDDRKGEAEPIAYYLQTDLDTMLKTSKEFQEGETYVVDM